MYDLGADGQGMSRVATMTQNSIVAAAGNIARCVNDFVQLSPVFPEAYISFHLPPFPAGQLTDLSSDPLSTSL